MSMLKINNFKIKSRFVSTVFIDKTKNKLKFNFIMITSVTINYCQFESDQSHNKVLVYSNSVKRYFSYHCMENVTFGSLLVHLYFYSKHVHPLKPSYPMRQQLIATNPLNMILTLIHLRTC